MVPMAGVEPARGCPHKILSLARLPIPSHRHVICVNDKSANWYPFQALPVRLPAPPFF